MQGEEQEVVEEEGYDGRNRSYNCNDKPLDHKPIKDKPIQPHPIKPIHKLINHNHNHNNNKHFIIDRILE